MKLHNAHIFQTMKKKSGLNILFSFTYPCFYSEMLIRLTFKSTNPNFLIKISLQKIVIAISISLLCCHFNSTESLQLIYNEGRQGLSDVRGKAHEHKKVGVIEKFLVNVVLYYLCISDGYGT